MKKMALTLLISVMVLPGVAFSSSASAEDQQQQKKKKKSTEVSFEDVLVQGKYHFSDEAVTTVEDDKILDALLGVRTDFKDQFEALIGSALRKDQRDETGT